MYKKINCVYNDKGPWCTNKKIKRSLFGLGARMCLIFKNKNCPYQKEIKSKFNIIAPSQGQK